MILSLHPCFDADNQIVLADRPINATIQKWIHQADAIILPQVCSQNLYDICTSSNAALFPNYTARIRYPGKIGQARLFRALGLPHPHTVSWESVDQFKDVRPDPTDLPLRTPFLVKEDQRHEAEGIFFVKNRHKWVEALDALALREGSGMKGFVIQQYVPCGGNVLRAVIIGKQIITYWKRPNAPDRPITTVSRGAIIDPDWHPDLQQKAAAQVSLLARKTGINLAAVDCIFPLSEKASNPLFLEINYYFGRRGLGGTERYYGLLHQAIQDWLKEMRMDPEVVRLA